MPRINASSPLGGVGPQEFESGPVNNSFIDELSQHMDAENLDEASVRKKRRLESSVLSRIPDPLVKEGVDSLASLSSATVNKMSSPELKHTAFLNMIDPNDPKKTEQAIEAFYGKIDKLGNGTLSNSQTV